MARIPEAEIERLKRDIAVERLATARGVELKPHGANLIGLCPFHADHEPSLVITPAKNLWHCLGACQSGGSVIDWVMQAEGVSFRHAVELLRTGDPSLAASPGRAPQRSLTPKLPLLLEADADNRMLLGDVVRYYQQTLQQSPETLRYLEQRGLRSAEMIERFQLGYANRTLGYRLPGKHVQAGAGLRGRLQHLGILRDTGHEHFAGSIVIPIFDEQGNVSELYGRKITRGLRPGTPLHLYLPGPHHGVWNVEALQAAKEIILCEALIDALTFWCAGFRNVTSAYGVEGFTADHLAAFQRYGTERVLIAYDRDAAGDGAAARLAEKLHAHGIGCFRVEFPKGMDANAYACKVTPAARSLGVVLRTARWLGAGPPPVITSVPETITVEITAQKEGGSQATGEVCEGAAADRHSLPSPVSELPSVSEASTPLAAEPTASDSVPPPRAEVATEVKPEEVVLTLGDRRYRVRGLAKNTAYDTLRVNVQVRRGDAVHTDTFDLYAAKQRAPYIKQAAEELGLEREPLLGRRSDCSELTQLRSPV